jgi:hypothetical protein
LCPQTTANEAGHRKKITNDRADFYEGFNMNFRITYLIEATNQLTSFSLNIATSKKASRNSKNTQAKQEVLIKLML